MHVSIVRVLISYATLKNLTIIYQHFTQKKFNFNKIRIKSIILNDIVTCNVFYKTKLSVIT